MSFLSSLGLGGLSSILQMGANSLSASLNYKYQKKLMDYQNQLNVQNWNMQNEYNTPVNQRSRLLDAGINPIFAQEGAAMVDGISPVGQASAPGFDFGSAIGTGVNAFNAQTQKSAVDVHNDYEKELTATEQQMRSGKVEFLGVQIEGFRVHSDAERQHMAVELIQAQNDCTRLINDIQLQWAQFSLSERQTAINEFQSYLDGLIKQQHLSQQEQRFIYEIFDIKAGINLKNAQANAANASARLSNAQADQQIEETNVYKKYGDQQAAANLAETRSRTSLNDRHAEESIARANSIDEQTRIFSLSNFGNNEGTFWEPLQQCLLYFKGCLGGALSGAAAVGTSH